MIVASLMYVLFTLVKSILSLIPDFAWNVDSVALTNFYEALRLVFYIVPADVVVAIIGLTIVITNIRIGVAVIKTIWQLIPFA